MTMNPDIKNYFDQLPVQRREALEAVRALILELAPHARETMRYRMPTYELDDVLCALGLPEALHEPLSGSRPGGQAPAGAGPP